MPPGRRGSRRGRARREHLRASVPTAWSDRRSARPRSSGRRLRQRGVRLGPERRDGARQSRAAGAVALYPRSPRGPGAGSTRAPPPRNRGAPGPAARAAAPSSTLSREVMVQRGDPAPRALLTRRGPGGQSCPWAEAPRRPSRHRYAMLAEHWTPAVAMRVLSTARAGGVSTEEGGEHGKPDAEHRCLYDIPWEVIHG